MLRLDSSKTIGVMYDGVGQNINQLQASERESQSCSLGDKWTWIKAVLCLFKAHKCAGKGGPMLCIIFVLQT